MFQYHKTPDYNPESIDKLVKKPRKKDKHVTRQFYQKVSSIELDLTQRRIVCRSEDYNSLLSERFTNFPVSDQAPDSTLIQKMESDNHIF